MWLEIARQAGDWRGIRFCPGKEEIGGRRRNLETSRFLSCRLGGGRAVSLLRVGQVMGWQEGAGTVSLGNKEEE